MHRATSRGFDVHQSGYVLLHVYAVDADSVRRIGRQVDIAVVADRLVVLRNLVPLHQVGVHVLLSVKLGYVGDLTVERETDLDGVLNGAFINDRQSPRQCHGNGIDDRVGFLSLVSRAGVREHLGSGVQLHMCLQTDYGFELSCDCGFCHLSSLFVRFATLCGLINRFSARHTGNRVRLPAMHRVRSAARICTRSST